MSTLRAFVDLLIAEVALVDPNIGRVFRVDPIWLTDLARLQDEGTFVLSAGGVLATAAEQQAGEKRTRFWMTETLTSSQPLDTCSVQQDHTIQLQAFYALRENGAEEDFLRAAVDLMLGHLSRESVELEALSTGDGYMGYLADPPSQISPIQVVTLGKENAGITGYMAEVQVTYHEAVSRAA